MIPSGLLEDERVRSWEEQHPREWWAFQTLDAMDPLKEKVLLSILDGVWGEDLDFLLLYADALEIWNHAVRQGKAESPPAAGLRRPYDVRILRHAQLRKENLFYRVDFTTSFGWSGFFDTSHPVHVKLVTRRPNVTLVAEVVEVFHPFLVRMGGFLRVL